jgi:hypothetical protein
MLFALPHCEHVSVEQPAVQRTHAHRVRINVNAPVLVKNFVSHEIGNAVPAARSAEDIHLSFASPQVPVKFGITP